MYNAGHIWFTGKRIMFNIFIVMILISMVLAGAPFVNAGETEDIQNREREIRLLEDLLESYVTIDDARWEISGEIHGINLPERGIAFLLPITLRSQKAITDFPSASQKRERIRMSTVELDSTKNELRRILTQFLGDYTHTLTWLQPDDNIILVVNMYPPTGMDKLLGFVTRVKKGMTVSQYRIEDEEKMNPRFSLSVTKRMVDDYRKRRITPEEFAEKTEFVEMKKMMEDNQRNFYRAIRTLETGFQSALRNLPEYPHRRIDIHSMYIPRYGVIYTIESSRYNFDFNFGGLDTVAIQIAKKAMKSAQEIIEDVRSKIIIDPIIVSPFGKGTNNVTGMDSLEEVNKRMEEVNKRMKKSQDRLLEANEKLQKANRKMREKQRSLIEKLAQDSLKSEVIKDNLLTTLAQFGHTLSLLQDYDYVTVVFLTKHLIFPHQKSSRIEISTTMGDIRRFYLGELSLDQFKEKANQEIFYQQHN